MAKKTEPVVVLEREYTVPLRRGWLKVPKYKRASKAVKTLKEFIARHMKLYDDDLRKIKIDMILNNEIRFRGMKKPPGKIKVKAKKFDNNIIRVELVNLPEIIKFKKIREDKKKLAVSKKVEEKKEEKTKVEEIKEKEDKKDETKEIKEKRESAKEESLKLSKEKAKETKHVSKEKKIRIRRMALSK